MADRRAATATRRRGRPLKVSRALAQRVGELVERGVSPVNAAIACGASKTSHHRWMREGEAAREMHPGGAFPESSRVYVEYVEQVEAGLARLEESLVAAVIEGAAADPKMALSVLARRFPAEWGEKRSGGAKDRPAVAAEEAEAPVRPSAIGGILAAAGGIPARAV